MGNFSRFDYWNNVEPPEFNEGDLPNVKCCECDKELHCPRCSFEGDKYKEELPHDHYCSRVCRKVHES